ncbi:MAG: hypothetical protein ACE5G6_06075 [Terriglobia bacterium]
MSGRKMVVVGLAALALLWGSVAGKAQRTRYGIEEWNAFQDTSPQVTQDPQQRLQHIETFLSKYPESILRVFVYMYQAQTAFSLQRYELAMEAANSLLAMDRAEAEDFLRQSNYNDLQVSNHFYAVHMIYAYSFLQRLSQDPEQVRELMEEARERARQGMQLHEQLYSQVSPPQDPQQRQQFEQEKKRAEGALRSVMNPHALLANVFWQKKDYEAAAREYEVALAGNPAEPVLNYRLGAASLQKKPTDYRRGFWHLARAIGLGINKSDDVRGYLARALAGYQQVPPDCLEGEVNELVARASETVNPPADWELISAEQVSAVRQRMSVKTIFDELEAGGESARLMFLAACGTEIGVGEDGQPGLAVMVLDVTQSEDNLVTLRAAAGQEAVDAKQVNVEVKVVGPEEAKNLKAEDVVRISGKISGYQNEPQFLVKLSEGRVHPEDLQ